MPAMFVLRHDLKILIADEFQNRFGESFILLFYHDETRQYPNKKSCSMSHISFPIRMKNNNS